MIVALIILGVVAWYISGVSGIIYWWTTEFDLEGGDLAFALFTGLVLGPIAWSAGYFIHRDSKSRVFLRKRGT